MKLLLDQGLPRSAAQLLRLAKFDAVHTGECGLASSSDSEIIQYARDHGQVVVTLDSDFHAIIALSEATRPSVVRIRLEGLRAENMANLLQHVLKKCRDDLAAGALVSVTEKHICIRRLPLIADKK